MHQFNTYKRNNIYYVRFKDPASGKWLSGISTGETEERAALATIYGWSRDGIPSRSDRTPESLVSTKGLIDRLRTAEMEDVDVESIIKVLADRGAIQSAVFSTDADRGPVGAFLEVPLEEYLLWFWDFDQSAYVANKIAHGHSIGRTHCDTRIRFVKKHWVPWLRENPTTLASATRATIDSFSLQLGKKDLSPQTKNHILTAGTAAFTYAFDTRIIRENPVAGISFYSTCHQKRGVLTQKKRADYLPLSGRATRPDWRI